MEDDGADLLISAMGSASAKPTQEAASSSASDNQASSTNDAIPHITSSAKTSVNISDYPLRSSLDAETAQFASDYNLNTTSTAKLTENVEDIVSDLENLLGSSSKVSKPSIDRSNIGFIPEISMERSVDKTTNLEAIGSSTEESMEPEEDLNTDERKIEASSFAPDEIIDDDAVLVRAAFEASSMSNVSSRIEDRQDDEQPASISDEDVIRAALDCTARNEEDDLIKAAQFSQTEAINAKRVSTDEERMLRMEELQQSAGLEYQTPLNILVDAQTEVSVVKEAESTTNDEHEQSKESSDENEEKAGEEYSSKICTSQELKLTIRKNRAEESSILKIYDPKDPLLEVSPSDSETEGEAESPLPKIIIKQSQISPKVMSPIKITFKQMKPEEQPQKASPKLIIKPIVKPDEELHHSPKITIKPIPKPEEHERAHSPKVTISPKIKIKPIVKPDDEEERIVLKISKNKVDESEKLAKIKVKFSMGGGHAHIVSEDEGKSLELMELEGKRQKFEMSLNDAACSMQKESATVLIVEPKVEVVAPTPKKRGRPRKVPLQVRVMDEEAVVVEQTENNEPPTESRSGRPKRSCRGVSVRDTLGIKPRKPRGRGRGRGRGARTQAKKNKATESKLKLIKEAALTTQINESFHYHDIEMKSEDDEASKERADVCIIPDVKPVVDMFEEDTRMSADITSGSQTPAKQIINNDAFVEESQSSVQSTATTESLKSKKPKIEIEPEGSVISADQLAEYYWGGGGPYMIQEQVAQFLGIKSFKRKYPGIPRRAVDMQERDFIRESGLASEHMCDLGLTAVNSADILDLMYSDFHFKYEEYCKHQRDRQTKDITNKQKALSLAASQEKNKIDIMQQAIESAAQWNATFNRTRRDERKACMDLQNFTVNYPKGRMRQINRPKIGHYPLALVPGQYTDYYKSFTPTDLNNLPLNTMLYHEIHIPHEEDSQSDGSASESETSSSGSDSSESDSSDEDCNICTPPHIGSSGSKRILT